MNNIIKYSNKIFNIAGFSIEVIINDESMECYIPFVFDSFVVYKSEKIDYKLYLGKNSDTIYNYKKLTNSVFVENGNYLIENENRYHITYRIFDNWNSWNLISNSCEYTQNENNTNWIFVNKENNEIMTHPVAASIYDWTAILGNIFAYSILNKDAIVFHGVIVEYNGVGFIISADSGVGKTTHARLWRDTKNALIINGDRAVCKKENGEWYIYGSPWSGTSGECINRKVPLKSIVMLEQYPTNEVEKLDSYTSNLKLMERAFVPYWDSNCVNKALDTISLLVDEVDIFKLKCNVSEDAVDVLYNAIFNLK